MDMARATTNAADEPTTRELREDAKAGRALKTNPGAWMLKQAADQQAKRERLEDAKAGLALKADPDALKLKQAADEQAKSERREDAKGGLALKPDPDALKLKGERLLATDPLKLSPPEAPEGRPLEALKEKLATPPGDDDVEALKRSGTGHGARRRLTRGNRRPALRSLVDPVETSRQHHALRDTTQALECEIKRWRGYVTSQFYAVATAADGTETIIRNSPSFRWRRSDLPETPGAAAALGTLVRSLQQEGWRVEDRGDEWFSVRLRQTQVGPSAGAAGAHQ